LHPDAGGDSDHCLIWREPVKRKIKLPKINFPCWVLPFVMSVLGEELLHIWTNNDIVFGRFAAVLAFAMGFGTFFALICSLLPPKAGKIVAMVLGFVQLVLYFGEYMIHDAFQSFMSWGTVQAGAGGVVSTYLVVVLKAIAKNFWRILLLALPIIACGLFVIPQKTKWIMRVNLAIAVLLFFLGAFGIVNGVDLDRANLKEFYNFDSAVRSFGVKTGFWLEIINDPNVAGNTNLEFELLPAPTEPPKPTEQTQPATEPDVTDETEPTEETTAPTEPPVVYGDHTLGLDFSLLA